MTEQDIDDDVMVVVVPESAPASSENWALVPPVRNSVKTIKAVISDRGGSKANSPEMYEMFDLSPPQSPLMSPKNPPGHEDSVIQSRSIMSTAASRDKETTSSVSTPQVDRQMHVRRVTNAVSSRSRQTDRERFYPQKRRNQYSSSSECDAQENDERKTSDIDDDDDMFETPKSSIECDRKVDDSNSTNCLNSKSIERRASDSPLCQDAPSMSKQKMSPQNSSPVISPLDRSRITMLTAASYVPTTRGRCFQCTTDLKMLCRMVGLHSNPKINEPGSMRISINGRVFSVEILASIDIGQNVKCLILRETMRSATERLRLAYLQPDHYLNSSPEYAQYLEAIDVNKQHLIFAFNWFSPRTVWDYMSLGYEITTKAKLDDSTGGILGSSYVEKARTFLNHPVLTQLLESKLGQWYQPVNPFSISNEKQARDARMPTTTAPESSIGLITCTGFSFGGAISHAFAYLLHGQLKSGSRIPLRVVGIGAPKPGNVFLSRWCLNTLSPDSLNILMYDEEVGKTPQDSNRITSNVKMIFDPVCLSPRQTDGFDYHPSCFLLHRRFGTLRKLCRADLSELSLLEEQDSRSSGTLSRLISAVSTASPAGFSDPAAWDKLHGLLKYYEGMCGMLD